jgi:cobalt-zinc-cadmium efflux system membrane fusion protein
MKKTIGYIAVATLAGGAALAVYYDHRQSGPDADQVAKASVAPREPGILRYPAGAPQLSAIKVGEVPAELPVPLAEPLNGRIAYNENFTARVSSPIAGRVVALKAQPGDRVNAGEVLLTLDSPELAQAAADLDKAKADDTRKQLAYERAKKLYEGEVLPRKDFESAEADLAQSHAETQRARLRLRNLVPSSSPGERFALRAPISGVVAERKANPGLEVRPDLPDPLYVITDPRHLWAIIDLPERNLAKVAEGHLVAVEVDAYPEQRFSAKIIKVGVTVDPATRRVQVRCELANPDNKLKPEMYARVTLLSDDNQRAVRVPNSAIITEGMYSFVFVEKSVGVFEKHRLSLRLQDRHFSYVDSGLKAGERIVVGGALLLNSELSAAN